MRKDFSLNDFFDTNEAEEALDACRNVILSLDALGDKGNEIADRALVTFKKELSDKLEENLGNSNYCGNMTEFFVENVYESMDAAVEKIMEDLNINHYFSKYSGCYTDFNEPQEKPYVCFNSSEKYIRDLRIHLKTDEFIDFIKCAKFEEIDYNEDSKTTELLDRCYEVLPKAEFDNLKKDVVEQVKTIELDDINDETVSVVAAEVINQEYPNLLKTNAKSMIALMKVCIEEDGLAETIRSNPEPEMQPYILKALQETLSSSAVISVESRIMNRITANIIFEDKSYSFNSYEKLNCYGSLDTQSILQDAARSILITEKEEIAKEEGQKYPEPIKEIVSVLKSCDNLRDMHVLSPTGYDPTYQITFANYMRSEDSFVGPVREKNIKTTLELFDALENEGYYKEVEQLMANKSISNVIDRIPLAAVNASYNAPETQHKKEHDAIEL